MKDNQAKRNQWPTGLITKTFPGEDGLARKVQVEIVKDGTRKTFSRPVTEVVCFFLQRLIPLINVGSLKTPSGECHAAYEKRKKRVFLFLFQQYSVNCLSCNGSSALLRTS